MFKAGQKVVCVNNDGVEEYLEEDKIYTIDFAAPPVVARTADDVGYVVLEEFPGDWYEPTRFKLVKEETNTITLETEKVEAWLESCADEADENAVVNFLYDMGYDVNIGFIPAYKVSKK
jgi:hypothetical protein